jgi:hypothetical protein
MESKLLKLKTDFNNIINIRTIVKNIFDILEIRIDKLKGLHAEFIKTSKTQMFIFGLDSFHFQSKLIDIEYDDMKRLFLAISNRMYCEYFKLYKIIVDYMLSNKDKTADHVKINNYPTYKDLEPFKEYNFEVIQDIHENILNLVSVLISALNNKENELLLHKNKQRIGLNIDNFITTFNYNINVAKEKIVMFITYIEFFHKLHTKYLKRFSNKIQLMYSHINNDINFDQESVNVKKHDNIKNSDENNMLFIDKTATLSLNDNITESDQESIDIISRSRTNSSISSNNTSNDKNSPKFKLKDVAKTISENTNKEPKQIEQSLSHDELNNMFFTIDMSCDSIINKTPVDSILEESLVEESLVEESPVERDSIKNYLIEPSNETE